MNKEKLLKYFQIIIFDDANMDENNISDVYNRLKSILKKKRYLDNFDNVKNNWLELPVIEVVDSILKFIQELEIVTV